MTQSTAPTRCDPLGRDAALAPAYDIVNTTAYIKEDSLALSLDGSKSLFASRLGIIALAQVCDVVKPRQRLQKLIAAVQASLRDNAEFASDAPGVFEAIEYSLSLYSQSFS
ncbi:hypothetical protein [Pseudomonas sp. CFII64]|uniref:hypothetical protein n=1 Tax=Pseudomonas sp. CFII64 TaxID=911242 RepID=UPI0012EBBF59|nr:hypothetical protein [Pseudomonas sp. CFII64]